MALKRSFAWFFHRLPSPAMVVALLALFVALGGVGYAAFVLPPGSVTSREVKDRSLLAQDFMPGQLPHGPRGPAGPPGKVTGGAITWEMLAPPEDWHEIPATSFLNGWHNTGGDWAPAAYYMDPLRNMHIRGSVSGGTVATSDAGDIALVPGPPFWGKLAFAAASETVGGAFVPAEVTVRLRLRDGPAPSCPLRLPSLYPLCTGAVVRAQAGANGRLSLDGITWRSESYGRSGVGGPGVYAVSVEVTPSRHVVVRVYADPTIKFARIRIMFRRGKATVAAVTRLIRTNRRVVVPNLIAPRKTQVLVRVIR